jgi:hypothetical protein
MGDIDNNEPERFLAATDALPLFKRLQIEERTRKDEERHGSELPLEMLEYLDSTPTYALKNRPMLRPLPMLSLYKLPKTLPNRRLSSSLSLI